MRETITMTSRDQRRAWILTKLLVGEVTTAEAAALLGLSERQVWRLRRAFEGDGPAALVHGNRGRASSRRLGEPVRDRIVELARTTSDGATGSPTKPRSSSSRARARSPCHDRAPARSRGGRRVRAGDQLGIGGEGRDHETIAGPQSGVAPGGQTRQRPANPSSCCEGRRRRGPCRRQGRPRRSRPAHGTR
jgi:hypothetical protein